MDVREVIRQRLEAGSRPGHRDDEHRVALVVEGGGARAAYSGGMCWAVEELGLLPAFDAVYGSSAGAINGAWLLTEEIADSIHAWWEPEIMQRAIAFHNPLRGRPIVDVDYLILHAHTHEEPMNFQRVIDSPVEYHPVITDAATGEAVDIADRIVDVDSLKQALRASPRMPVLVGPPLEVGGHAYVDGGLAENVPVITAKEQGATHIVALRTRDVTYEPKDPNLVEKWGVAAFLQLTARGTVQAWLDRPDKQREIVEALRGDDVVQVHVPVEAPAIMRTVRDPDKLKHAVEVGHEAALEVLRPAAPA